MAAASTSSSSQVPDILALKKGIVDLIQLLIDKGDVFQWQEPKIDAKLDLTDFLFQLNSGKSIPNPLFPKSTYFKYQVAKLSIPLPKDVQQRLTFQTTKPVPSLVESETAIPINLQTIVVIWYYLRVFNAMESVDHVMKFLSLNNESIAHIDILDHFDVDRIDPDERCPLTHHRLANIIADNFFIDRTPKVNRSLILINTQSALIHEFLAACKSQEKQIPDMVSTKEIFSEENLISHLGTYYLQVPLEIFMITFVHDFLGVHGHSWSRHQDDFL